MPVTLETPQEVAVRIAERVRTERLARKWTQAELASRAGVGLPTYRLFEQTGQVSLDRLLSITCALGRLGEWEELLKPRPAQSIDEVVAGRPTAKRGTPIRGSRR